MKYQENCRIFSQEKIAPGIFSMWLQTDQIAKEAVPGQFVSVYSRDENRLLPRPISICDADPTTGRIRLVYRVTGPGTGTEGFSLLHKDVSLKILGPVGNGYPLQKAEGKRVVLVGGGIGIPPLLYLARKLGSVKAAVLGYRDCTFLDREFLSFGETLIATEDGSTGTKGNVLDVLRESRLCPELIFSCGPRVMLRALRDYAQSEGCLLYVSMEERMACGIGACLGCVTASKEVDPHSNVRNRRVCVDGPVFEASEIEL